MSFERARSKENKVIRLNQIKEAAITLFDNITYQEITISKIAMEINFTRANLYKYISTKEDIYLYILIDEFESLIEDMNQVLTTQDAMNSETFSKTLAEILDHHKRFMKLLSLLFTIFEPNASINILVDFKNYLHEAKNSFFEVYKYNFPEFKVDDLVKLIDYTFSLIIARYPFSYPNQNQIEATKISASDYVFPDFIDSFSEVLTLIIKGMKLSRL